MNRPSTFIISLVLLILLTITTLVTLIAYSPTFNRPITRMLGMIDLAGESLPGRVPSAQLGQPSWEEGSPETSTFRSPHGLAVDRSLSPDVLWVADTDNHRVLGYLLGRTMGPDSQPDFVRGQPGAGRAELNEPIAVAVDADGGLYIADLGNNRVVHHSRPFEDSLEADWLFGHPDWKTSNALVGVVGPLTLNRPGGIDLDEEGNLYIADTGNHRILRIPGGADGDGMPDRVWGQGGSFEVGDPNGGGDVSARGLFRPSSIAVGREGLLAVADTGNNRVLIYDTNSPEDAAIGVLGQHGDFTSADANRDGVSALSLNSPQSVVFGPTGLFVADTGNHRVLHFPHVEPAAADAVWGQGRSFDLNAAPTDGPTNENLSAPCGLAIDSKGQLYIADRDHHRVMIHAR